MDRWRMKSTSWPSREIASSARKGAPLGTWGPGPFENDAAMDWALGLGRSGDPDLPQSVLHRLDKAASHNARVGAVVLAAAEAIAASRGHAAERLPDEFRQWLAAANPRADAAAAELALGVLAKVQGEDSELRLLWAEVDGSRWRSTLDDLRRRLREPARAGTATPPQPRRQVPGPPRIGDVIELLTSTGKAAYVQYVGETDRSAHELIRIMPGFSNAPLDDAGLASLAAGDTVFLSQGSFRLLTELTGSRARGNHPVPGPCTGPQPLKHHQPSAEAPGGGAVSYAGQNYSAEEFARMYPDIDQTMLTEWSDVPSPGTLLRMIERDWRPWMAHDDGLILADDPGVAPAIPRRPAPYPVTAQPGKFLLDR
jgi:hypothetical protein